MLLAELLQRYVAARDIGPDAVRQLGYAVRLYSRHLQKPAQTEHLNPVAVNNWLAAEVGRVSRRTAKNYRASILTLWRAAYDDFLTEVPPLRVRKIKAPLPPVEAYERDEIESLLSACDALSVKWRYLMRAYILTAWYTCFRVGDLMLLRWSEIDAKHQTVTIIQHKTGQVITRPLERDAIEAIELSGAPKRKLVFGEALDRRQVWKIFVRLKKAAGITRGCPKWIRRASSTAIMLAHGEEAGSKALGHKTPGLARKHYFAAKHVLADQLRAPRLRGRKSRA